MLLRVLTLLCCLSSPAYAFSLSGDKWDQPEVTYAFDASVPAYAKPVFKTSFQTWSVVALRSSIVFSEATSTPADITIQWSPGPLVIGGLQPDAVATSTQNNHVFTSATIIINSKYDWTKPTVFGDTLTHLSLHEIGHALGLGDSVNPISVMAEVSPFQTLERDDVLGIAAIYTVPPSDLVLFKSTLDRILQKYAVLTKFKVPLALQKSPLSGNYEIAIGVGVQVYYFDAQTEAYIGLLSGRKFSFKTGAQ